MNLSLPKFSIMNYLNHSLIIAKKTFYIACFFGLMIGGCTARPLSEDDVLDGFEDLTIVVNSCDKYQELWQPFFKILFMQWKELSTGKIPIILITNTKDFHHPSVRVFQSGPEISWSDTFKRALKTVQTKYVLYLQEDYFLTSLNVDRLRQLYTTMKAKNLGYMQIYGGTREIRNPLSDEPGVYYKNQFEKWRTSLQAAIWDTQTFSHLLNSCEKIWDFEVKGSTRSEGNMAPFAVVISDLPLQYLNMAAEGFLIDNYINDIKERYGITWVRKLPLDSSFSIARLCKKTIPRFLYWQLYMPLVDFVKGIFVEQK